MMTYRIYINDDILAETFHNELPDYIVDWYYHRELDCAAFDLSIENEDESKLLNWIKVRTAISAYRLILTA